MTRSYDMGFCSMLTRFARMDDFVVGGSLVHRGFLYELDSFNDLGFLVQDDALCKDG